MTDYTERLLSIFSSGLIEPGEVSIASVEHRPECPTLDGGECQCIPTITVTTPSVVIHVGADGSTRKELRQCPRASASALVPRK